MNLCGIEETQANYDVARNSSDSGNWMPAKDEMISREFPAQMMPTGEISNENAYSSVNCNGNTVPNELAANGGRADARAQYMMEYLAKTLEAKRARWARSHARGVLCPFCRNKGASPALYTSHTLRDATGKLLCPVLRSLSFPLCHATGDNVRTIASLRPLLTIGSALQLKSYDKLLSINDILVSDSQLLCFSGAHALLLPVQHELSRNSSQNACSLWRFGCRPIH